MPATVNVFDNFATLEELSEVDQLNQGPGKKAYGDFLANMVVLSDIDFEDLFKPILAEKKPLKAKPYIHGKNGQRWRIALTQVDFPGQTPPTRKFVAREVVSGKLVLPVRFIDVMDKTATSAVGKLMLEKPDFTTDDIFQRMHEDQEAKEVATLQNMLDMAKYKNEPKTPLGRFSNGDDASAAMAWMPTFDPLVDAILSCSKKSIEAARQHFLNGEPFQVAISRALFGGGPKTAGVHLSSPNEWSKLVRGMRKVFIGRREQQLKQSEANAVKNGDLDGTEITGSSPPRIASGDRGTQSIENDEQQGKPSDGSLRKEVVLGKLTEDSFGSRDEQKVSADGSQPCSEEVASNDGVVTINMADLPDPDENEEETIVRRMLAAFIGEPNSAEWMHGFLPRLKNAIRREELRQIVLRRDELESCPPPDRVAAAAPSCKAPSHEEDLEAAPARNSAEEILIQDKIKAANIEAAHLRAAHRAALTAAVPVEVNADLPPVGPDPAGEDTGKVDRIRSKRALKRAAKRQTARAAAQRHDAQKKQDRDEQFLRLATLARNHLPNSDVDLEALPEDMVVAPAPPSRERRQREASDDPIAASLLHGLWEAQLRR